MEKFQVKCYKCGKVFSHKDLIWKCNCGGFLDITFDLSAVSLTKNQLEKIRDTSIWRYSPLLPIVDTNKVISLGEGGTPIIVRKYRGVKICYKLDFLNPTASFKDRGSAVAVSHALEIGVREIIEDSSGNAGASIAAYARAAGIKCRVFVPYDAPKGKVFQIMLYGADIVKVRGDRSKVHEEAIRAVKEGAYYIGHLWNPYFIEGIKTLAYEAIEQNSWNSYDATILPIGSGGLLIGVYKGFKEFKELSLIDKIPRIYGVQSEECPSVYNLFHGLKSSYQIPGEPLADGIAVPNPPRASQVIEIVKNTNGDIVLVSREEIINALKELLKLGLFVEPTSATSLAALYKLVEQGYIEQGEEVLIPLTGIGFKAFDKITKLLPLK